MIVASDKNHNFPGDISAEKFVHGNLSQRDKDHYDRSVPAIEMGYTVKLCSSFWQTTRNGEGRRQWRRRPTVDIAAAKVDDNQGG